MGIYDREYYRSEGPSFLGSFASRGQVCKWLILVNVGVFVLQLLTRYHNSSHYLVEPITNAFLLDVHAVMQGQVWRLLTYAFLHDTGDILHLVFNMLFLWWFGSDVEDLYGPKEFLAFYLLSAFLGGVAFQLGWLLDLTPGAQLCLGASGAVTAVMVVCACHYPTRVIYLMMIIPVPIWFFVAFQAASDLFGVLGGGGRSNTAYTVHLGGAAFGFLYHWYNWRVLNWLPSFRGLQRQRARPNLRVYHEEAPRPVPVAAAPAGGGDVDEQLEAKLDAVLEKVARTGQSSLTDSEKQILMRASEVYRRRRS
jgi:membrane associated rhomboid family serine protease